MNWKGWLLRLTVISLIFITGCSAQSSNHNSLNQNSHQATSIFNFYHKPSTIEKVQHNLLKERHLIFEEPTVKEIQRENGLHNDKPQHYLSYYVRLLGLGTQPNYAIDTVQLPVYENCIAYLNYTIKIVNRDQAEIKHMPNKSMRKNLSRYYTRLIRILKQMRYNVYQLSNKSVNPNKPIGQSLFASNKYGHFKMKDLKNLYLYQDILQDSYKNFLKKQQNKHSS